MRAGLGGGNLSQPGLPMRLIQGLTLLLPWVVVPGVANPYLEPRSLLLTLGLWGIVWWGLTQTPHTTLVLANPWLPWLGFYVIASNAFIFQWRYLQRTASDTVIIQNSYVWEPTVGFSIALLAAYIMATRFLQTMVAVQHLTQWFTLSLLLTCLYGLGQWVGLDQFYVQGTSGGVMGHLWSGLRGSFGNPEHFGLYLALLCPLLLLFAGRKSLMVFALLMGVLYLTYSKGSWLIAAITLSTYGFLRGWTQTTRWWRVALVAVTGIGLVCLGYGVFSLAVGDERVTLWQTVWGFLDAKQPGGSVKAVASWTGRGLGSFALLMSRQPDEWLRQTTWAHNEWLQGLMQLGVIGVLLVGGVVAWTTRRAWQRAQTSLIDQGWLSVWMGWLASSVIYPVAHWPHLIWIGLCAWSVFERGEGV